MLVSEHVYIRTITHEDHSSLAAIARQITSGSEVLDIGCGSGSLGNHLAKNLKCRVDGITYSEEEARLAREYYQSVWVFNLEADASKLDTVDMKYDFVVCADILEHLRNPDEILSRCHSLLKEEGKLLISIPNIGYAGVIASLLHGKFQYSDEGILDRTHVRFFTLSSATDLIERSGWKILHNEAIVLDLDQSEFYDDFLNLPPKVQNELLTSANGGTYQFIFGCTPGLKADESPVTIPPRRPIIGFSSALYWSANDLFSESQKIVVRAEIGVTRQQISFPIDVTRSSIKKLRLDPADRPGYLRLYSCKLLSTSGEIIWQWSPGGAPLFRKSNEIFWGGGLPGDTGLSLLVTGSDPQIELDIPPILLSNHVNPIFLSVELGWPASLDFETIAARLTGMQFEHAQASHIWKTRQIEYEDKIRELILLGANAEKEAKNIGRIKLESKQLLYQIQLLSEDKKRLETEVLALKNLLVVRLTRPIAKWWRIHGYKKQAHQVADMKLENQADIDVSIIIPVYRGIEETRKCIDSVIGSKNQASFKLIIINDCSPEPDLTLYLRSLPKQFSWIELLENKDNFGFVKTVNIGMKHAATNDVVLLNSDTEVANDWLDRLKGAAYSSPRVGSVTPFSNNATICSFPRFCSSNDLPLNQSTASLDLIFKAANPGDCIEIPTGVGFCMYIRRDCLADVGDFDEDNFGKGYGEENDFCVRATKNGWKHLLAANVFVFHSGGASFGESKAPREIAAMETLRQLHPTYEPSVHQFVANDPPRVYRIKAEIQRLAQTPLPKILMVLHNRGGGTLRHVHELIRDISSSAHGLKLYPSSTGEIVLDFGQTSGDLKLYFKLEEEWEEFIEILQSIRIDLVHFHHTLGLPDSLIDLPTTLGCQHDFTIHDYFSLCPQISLTELNNHYCGELGVDQCNNCLIRLPAPKGVDILNWRNSHRHLLETARFVFSPSNDTARRFENYFPEANIVVKPHTDMREPSTSPKRPRLVKDRLRVAVLGALSPIKGADVLESVACHAAKNGVAVEFHLVGYAYRALHTLPHANLIVYGKYEECDLSSIIEHIKPDVIWFPALWPETYSYTLSSALAANLPIIAPLLGAFPERLTGRAWTWLVKWHQTTEEWVVFFKDLHDSFFSVDFHWPAMSEAPLCRDKIFSYLGDYIPCKTNTNIQKPMPSHTRIKHHAFERTTLSTGSRKLLLNTLVHLRNAPLLKHIARRIPLHWQTRIKTRLQGR